MWPVYLAALAIPALAAGQGGSNYKALRPEQQKLVSAWLAEYRKITGRSAETSSYDALPLSTKTTFDAVTHALLNTRLTDKAGASLGTALDLVELVEGVNGQIPEARGDHQFRLYVKLTPEGLRRLYRCREFVRTRDNTIYHIGYPINFRQQGGTPSVQISVTRTGRRADIDVDYRSSSGPKALVNGHLTSANSDVRAGRNYWKHEERWNGLTDWWRSLLGLFNPAREETTIAAGVKIADHPKVKDSAPVQEAVADYFKSWLVDGKPEEAMAYLSVKAFACLAEYQTGESIDSGLASFRLLQHMRQSLDTYGKAAALGDVVAGAPVYTEGARPVQHDQSGAFSLEHVTDEMARAMDCRVRLRTNLAEELPPVTNEFRETYVSLVRMLKEPGPPVYMSHVWTREEGHWKIVSFHIEHPLRKQDVPVLTPRASEDPRRARRLVVSGDVAGVTESFLRLWLIDHNYAKAADVFDETSGSCADVKNAGSPRAFLASVAGMMPRRRDLPELIQTVQHGHSQMEEVSHPNAKEYLLARVSNELAASYECAAGDEKKGGSKDGSYRGERFQTIFRLRQAQGTAGSVVLQWGNRKGRWVVSSAEIVSR